MDLKDNEEKGFEKLYKAGKKAYVKVKELYNKTLGQEGQDRRFIKRAEKYEKLNEKREEQMKKYGYEYDKEGVARPKMKINKKGQFEFIHLIAYGLVFIIFFVFALAPFVDTVLDNSQLSNLGGLGAMIIGSFNLWILLAFVILIFGALIYGFSRSE